MHPHWQQEKRLGLMPLDAYLYSDVALRLTETLSDFSVQLTVTSSGLARLIIIVTVTPASV